MEKNKNQTRNAKNELPKKTGYIVAIVLLSALLIASNLFSYFGIWQKLVPDTNPVFLLGKATTLDAKLNQANAVSFTLKGSAVTNVFYQHPISLQMPTTTQKYIVRAKMQLETGANQISIQIATDSNWIQGEDGYAYLNSAVGSGQNVLIANGYVLPEFEADQNKTYNLCLIVETLAQSTNYAEIWTLPRNFVLLEPTLD